MATIKSYTDIEQSKKLAEILLLESADMRYAPFGDTHPWVWDEEVKLLENGAIPCWSLAALLDILPEYNLQRTDWENKTEYKIVITINEDNYASHNYDNPLDACYELIVKLYESKIL